MEEKVESFVRAADGAGYTALQGTYHCADPVAMYEAGILPDANDVNVGHSYMAISLPAHPGQPVPNTTPAKSDDEQLWATYRLRRDEAIVFIGTTPPQVDYFSMRSYLFWRFYPERCAFEKTFASLGDTLNIRTISTGSDEPCGQPVAIVSTASVTTFNRIRTVLVDAGFPPSAINCDQIPESLIKTGVEPPADQLTFLCRSGNFENGDAGRAYVENEDGSSGVAFRLVPKASIENPKTGGRPSGASLCAVGEDSFLPSFAPRGSGNPQTNELRLLPAMRVLRQKILEKYAPTHSPSDLETDIWIFEGADALQRGIDAFGEDRDTTYLQSSPFTLAADDREFAIVYGVNHQAFGKVTYNNFGVYDAKTLAGVCSRSSFQGGLGTGTSAFFEGTGFEGLADRFYVYRIGRKAPTSDDGIPFLQVPYEWKYDEANNETVVNRGRVIPVEQEMFVGFRAYLDQETNVGPAWWEMVYDRTIKFSPYGRR